MPSNELKHVDFLVLSVLTKSCSISNPMGVYILWICMGELSTALVPQLGFRA